jgi:hypothetical protein
MALHALLNLSVEPTNQPAICQHGLEALIGIIADDHHGTSPFEVRVWQAVRRPGLPLPRGPCVRVCGLIAAMSYAWLVCTPQNNMQVLCAVEMAFGVLGNISKSFSCRR